MGDGSEIWKYVAFCFPVFHVGQISRREGERVSLEDFGISLLWSEYKQFME